MELGGRGEPPNLLGWYLHDLVNCGCMRVGEQVPLADRPGVYGASELLAVQQTRYQSSAFPELAGVARPNGIVYPFSVRRLLLFEAIIVYVSR